MITIAQATAQFLYDDEIAREALVRGVLNLSSYAKQLQPQIEERLYKNVQVGSIVTALSRLTAIAGKVTPLKATVHIEDMSIKSPLCELTYEKTVEVCRAITRLGTRYSGRGFFTSTQGMGEITLIAAQEYKEEIVKLVSATPKGLYDNLAAITVRFREDQYIEVPNMIYTLVSALAVRRINLIEIVSTYTEISFIVRQADMNQVVEVFRANFLNA